MDPTHTLPVPDPKDPSIKRTAAIKTPQELTYFSFDATHTYAPDDSGLRYYYTPQAGAELNAGFDTFQKLDDSADGHLDALLRSVRELEQRAGARVEVDVVTWRGMLTKFMVAPYSDDDFEMNATSFQGTIYLEEHNPSKLARQAAQSFTARRGQPSSALASYWGYKFETLSTLPRPWAECTRDEIEARTSAVVANASQFISVATSRVGETSFLIAGEVDAVWDVKHPPAPFPKQPGEADASDVQRSAYVELKTATKPAHRAAAARFENKLLRFWAQSFLLGVPRVVLGWRSAGDAPVVTGVSEYATTGIPRMVREGEFRSWESGVCLAFLEECLGFVKRWVKGEGVWRVRLRRERGVRPAVEVFRVEETGVGRVVSEEFVRWRMGGDLGNGGGGGDGEVEGETRPETPPSC